MNKLSSGVLIKAARQKQQLSQIDLCRITKLTPPRLSKLENDLLYPTRDEWQRLNLFLSLGNYVPREQINKPCPPGAWKAGTPVLNRDSERSLAARLYASQKSFAKLTNKAIISIKNRPDMEVCERFLQQALLESGYEYLFWVRLLAAGGRPGWYSPSKAGYRDLAVVDRKSKKQAGDLKHPCLSLESRDYDALFFPQVTLDTRKTYYRLDALVCIRWNRRRIWVDVEVDGPGHNGEFNRIRQRDLRLETLRLTKTELSAPCLVESLNHKFKPMLDLRQAG